MWVVETTWPVGIYGVSHMRAESKKEKEKKKIKDLGRGGLG